MPYLWPTMWNDYHTNIKAIFSSQLQRINLFYFPLLQSIDIHIRSSSSSFEHNMRTYKMLISYRFLKICPRISHKTQRNECQINNLFLFINGFFINENAASSFLGDVIKTRRGICRSLFFRSSEKTAGFAIPSSSAPFMCWKHSGAIR